MPTFNLEETIALTRETIEKFAQSINDAVSAGPNEEAGKQAAVAAVGLAIAAFADLAGSITRIAHATERHADAQEALLAVAIEDLTQAVAEGVAASHATIKQKEMEEAKRSPIGGWPVDLNK